MFSLAASPACRGGDGGGGPVDPPNAFDGGFASEPTQGSSSGVPDSVDPDDYIDPSARVGSLGGTFSVKPNGEASYTLPIQVQPGRGGLQPSLNLTYASNGGTREAGKGWTLSGLSSVTRCPDATSETLGTGGFGETPSYAVGSEGAFPSSLDPDTYHTLCLDGQLMIPVTEDGSEFALAGEPNIKITASFPHGMNAAGSFTAHLADGTTQVYTSALDEAVLAGSSLNGSLLVPRVRRWPMIERSDRSGNKVSYHYESSLVPSEAGQATANHRLSNVSYVGGSVDLLYTDEPLDAGAEPQDRRVWFWRGARTEEDSYLRTLRVRGASDTIAREYVFEYERSETTGDLLLTSAEMCDHEGVCLPATKFEYSNLGDDPDGDGLVWRQSSLSPTNDPLYLNEVELDSLTQADLNQDGLPDLLYLSDRVTGWYQQNEYVEPDLVVKYVLSVDGGHYASPVELAVEIPFHSRLTTGDLDGDGFVEPIVFDTEFESSGGAGVPMDFVARLEIGGRTGQADTDYVTVASAGTLAGAGGPFEGENECEWVVGNNPAECPVTDFVDIVILDSDGDSADEVWACTAAYDAYAGFDGNDDLAVEGPGTLYWERIGGGASSMDLSGLECASECKWGNCSHRSSFEVVDVTGDGSVELLQVPLVFSSFRANFFEVWDEMFGKFAPPSLRYRVFGPQFPVEGHLAGGEGGTYALPASVFQRYNAKRGSPYEVRSPYGAEGGLWTDFNGDGVADLVRFEPRALGESIDITNAYYTATYRACGSEPHTPDVDGYTQSLDTEPIEPFEAGLALFLGRGDGSFEYLQADAPFSSWSDYCDRFQDAVAVDIDGNRIAELLIPKGGDGSESPTFDVARFSDGARDVSWTSIEMPTWGYVPDRRRVIPFDLTGSGMSGYLMVGPESVFEGEYPVEAYGREAVPDVLSAVTDGYGARTDVEYGALYEDGVGEDDGVYRSAACPEGYAEVPPRWPLVSRVSSELGDDTRSVADHRYEGSCHDLPFAVPGVFERHEVSMGIEVGVVTSYSRKIIETRDNYERVQGQPVFQGSVTRLEEWRSGGKDGRFEHDIEISTQAYEEGFFDREGALIRVNFVAPGKVVETGSEFSSWAGLGSCAGLGPDDLDGGLPCEPSGTPELMLSTSRVVQAWDERGGVEEVETVDGEFCSFELSEYESFEHTRLLSHGEVSTGKILNGECDTTTAAGAPTFREFTLHRHPSTWLIETKEISSPGEPVLFTTYQHEFGQATRISKVVDAEGDDGTSATVRTWDRTFDSNGLFELWRTNPLGHVTSTAWHPRLGLPVAVVDTNGVAAIARYDGFGRTTGSEVRLHVVAEPMSPPSETRYERVNATGEAEGLPSPLRVVSVSPTGSESVVEHDALGRVVYNEWDVDANLRVYSQTIRSFEPFGPAAALPEQATPMLLQTSHPEPVGDGALSWSRTESDGLGRVISSRPAAADIGETTYRYEGRTSIVEGPEPGSVWSSTVSMSGLLERSVDAEGIATCFYYGAGGRLRDVAVNPTASTCDGSLPADGPRRSSAHFEYNNAGAVTLRDVPGRSPEAADYNGFGERWRAADASGVTTWQYDALGRTESRTDSGVGTATFDWDADEDCAWADGMLRRTTSPDGAQREYAYDAFGRVSHTSMSMNDITLGVGYRYNDNGQLEELRHLAGPTIKRRFDDLGALSRVLAEGQTLWTATSRNELGVVDNAVYGNGVEESHLYVQGLLRESHLLAPNMTAPFPGASTTMQEIDSIALEYDINGRVEAREIPHLGLREEFDHDRIGRLLSGEMRADGQLVDSWDHEYWETGAIRSRSGVGDYVYGSAVAPLGVTDAGGVSYKYDADGRQISRGDFVFAWNRRGRLRSAVSEKTQIAYHHDASDARVLKQEANASGVTSTYYGEGVELEISANAEEYTYYVPGESGPLAALRRQAGASEYEVLYTHANDYGSSSVVTDDAGDVVQRMDFDAFGRERSLMWNPSKPLPAGEADLDLGFTGHRKAEAYGLIDMGGRHYDPHLARFASPDPFIVAPMSSQGYDPFAYVFNDPLSYTDPSGFEPVAAEGISRTVVVSADAQDAAAVEAAILSSIGLIPSLLAVARGDMGTVDGAVETDAARPEGASGTEPEGEDVWDGKSGLAPLDSTRVELPRLPTPDFSPLEDWSLANLITRASDNALAIVAIPVTAGTNGMIGMGEGILNIPNDARAWGELSGRGLARAEACSFAGTCTTSDVLLSLEDLNDGARKGGEAAMNALALVSLVSALRSGLSRGFSTSGRKSGVPESDFVPEPSAGKYKRPSGAGPTKAQREAVQGQPCVDCGRVTPRQVADHKDPLVVEHYRTGGVDTAKQSGVDAVQPHCPTCSSSQGGQLSAFSRRMNKILGL